MTASRLRSDARRNRTKILGAARAAFASDGLDAPTAAIARAAGVGTATLYRHFPTRDDLVDAVFGEEVRHCLALCEEATVAPDPWRGLSRALEAVVALELASPGLAGTLLAERRCTPLLESFDREVRRGLMTLAARLRDEGAARADLTGGDLLMVLTAVRAITLTDRAIATRSAKRFIAIATAGLRGDGSALRTAPQSRPREEVIIDSRR
ncbi:TetR family transcriptional regulator [Xylanimonas oleitrophica]|uniref:TetR family transcriptional regulator n=1 Tax=Xylanimonas oleitrophica TaxID=2607479 RepID=A0A2W5WUL8_9MICO|nr:TetR/AcrR family transcriptional regulator [Xylanimonas oleitrophica]PZR51946.1 TetR family transcriptional regulator [Xylanimonas oleitrophica]